MMPECIAELDLPWYPVDSRNLIRRHGLECKPDWCPICTYQWICPDEGTGITFRYDEMNTMDVLELP